jgi:lipopolysaccharide export system protein LptA
MKKIKFKLSILLLMLALCTSVFAITIESKRQEIDLENNKGVFEGDVKVQIGDVVVVSPKADLELEPETKKPSLATFLEKPYAYQMKGSKKHEVKADIIKVSLINKIITAQGSSQSNVLQNSKPIIIISADMQEYDTKTNLMKAVGSVVINYEDMVATSDNAFALLDKTGDVHNIKLTSRKLLKRNLESK